AGGIVAFVAKARGLTAKNTQPHLRACRAADGAEGPPRCTRGGPAAPRRTRSGSGPTDLEVETEPRTTLKSTANPNSTRGVRHELASEDRRELLVARAIFGKCRMGLERRAALFEGRLPSLPDRPVLESEGEQVAGNGCQQEGRLMFHLG